MTKIKICGITDEQGLQAAINCHADFIGFVFYPASARAISISQAAGLTSSVPEGIKKVGLFVDPDDESLSKILSCVPLDFIQLHGSESPDRTAEIKDLSGKKLIKAVRIAGTADVMQAHRYGNITDWLLFDAAVPGLAGGSGAVFDWSLLTDQRWPCPWMLAGGLNTANVQEAISRLRPDAVDVSSGVEDAPGFKNPARIADFIERARQSG